MKLSSGALEETFIIFLLLSFLWTTGLVNELLEKYFRYLWILLEEIFCCCDRPEEPQVKGLLWYFCLVKCSEKTFCLGYFESLVDVVRLVNIFFFWNFLFEKTLIVAVSRSRAEKKIFWYFDSVGIVLCAAGVGQFSAKPIKRVDYINGIRKSDANSWTRFSHFLYF